MKVKNSKKFGAEEEVLDINVMDSEGNPIKNESADLTQEQIDFASKLAYAKYKKFSASKVKKFDAETEQIDVQIPEDIEAADIDALAEEASAARDAEFAENADENEVTVKMTAEDPDQVSDECAECAEMVKEFAAKMRKFSRKAKKFEAEDLEPIKEALEEVTDAVEDLVEEQNAPEAPAEAETIVEACQQFCANLKRLRSAKKFSAEDLEELEKIEDHIEDTVEEINNTVVENPEEGADGVADIKKFAATATAKNLARSMGAGSLDAFKANFFGKK